MQGHFIQTKDAPLSVSTIPIYSGYLIPDLLTPEKISQSNVYKYTSSSILRILYLPLVDE